MEVKDLNEWTLSRTDGTGGTLAKPYDLVIANPPYSSSRAERMESYQRDMEDAGLSSGRQSRGITHVSQEQLSNGHPSIKRDLCTHYVWIPAKG